MWYAAALWNFLPVLSETLWVLRGTHVMFGLFASCFTGWGLVKKRQEVSFPKHSFDSKRTNCLKLKTKTKSIPSVGLLMICHI